MFCIGSARYDTFITGEVRSSTSLPLSTLPLKPVTSAFPHAKKQVMENDRHDLNDAPTDSSSQYSEQSTQAETDMVLRVESMSGKNLKVQCAAACLPACHCSPSV